MTPFNGSENIGKNCRTILEEIWCCWPDAGIISAPALAHAESCGGCKAELEAFRNLCRRSTTDGGEAFTWAGFLPNLYWEKFAASVKGALNSKPAAPGVPIWAPALTLAAAGIVLFLRTSSPPKNTPQSPALNVPAEAVEPVEEKEMIEHLDLLEDWEVIETFAPEQGGKP